jgi:3-oxoacyl-[acyl-carrier-protein] synthase-1
MTEVYIAADNVFSPVGVTTAENFERLKAGISGVKLQQNEAIAYAPFYASLFTENEQFKSDRCTKFEQLLIASIQEALEHCDIRPGDDKTILIISTTKGNISMLETETDSAELQHRIALPTSARLVAEHFGFLNTPVIVSNACISGIMAILTGLRLIRSGKYENAVISGADEITKFVLSGFQSFQAISAEPCKPFDENRRGITLGEGAATMVLSSNPRYSGKIQVLSGSVTNDANHISAPSRTGEELSMAINKTLNDANVAPPAVDIVSAHGTATSYNDEMEAKALALAGLQQSPVNSLKGFYGHTLGAAGLIESIISIQSLRENVFLPTPGFETLGVPLELNINKTLLTGNFTTCLKTASGFGGCNAAVLFSK